MKGYYMSKLSFRKRAHTHHLVAVAKNLAPTIACGIIFDNHRHDRVPYPIE